MDYAEYLGEIINNQQALILTLENRFTNLEKGFEFLLYIAVAFFVWQVIKVLYGLFGRVFFGGV